jgi:hypothetical protein
MTGSSLAACSNPASYVGTKHPYNIFCDVPTCVDKAVFLIIFFANRFLSQTNKQTNKQCQFLKSNILHQSVTMLAL